MVELFVSALWFIGAAEASTIRVGARQVYVVPQTVFDEYLPAYVYIEAKPALIRTVEATASLNRAWSVGAAYLGTDSFDDIRKLAAQVKYKDGILRVEYGTMTYRISDSRDGRALNVNGDNPGAAVLMKGTRTQSSYRTVSMLWDERAWVNGSRFGFSITRYDAPAVYDIEVDGSDYVLDLATRFRMIGVAMSHDMFHHFMHDPINPSTRGRLYTCGRKGQVSTCFGATYLFYFGVTVQTPSRSMPLPGPYEDRVPNFFWQMPACMLDFSLAFAHAFGNGRPLFLQYGAVSRAKYDFGTAPGEISGLENLTTMSSDEFLIFGYVGPYYRVEYGPFVELGMKF